MLDDPPRSWRAEHGASDVLEVALFVRDAAGLLVSDGPAVPRLANVSTSPPIGVDLLSAGAQWRGWFGQLIELELADRPTSGSGRDRARQVLARRRAVCDPPDFAALADHPELRAAACAVFTGHRQWSRSLRRPGSDLSWALLRQTAEDVAFDHRVRIDRVQARFVLLPVPGSWWVRAGPGFVLCSAAAVEDPVIAQVLVHDAFVSGLDR